MATTSDDARRAPSWFGRSLLWNLVSRLCGRWAAPARIGGYRILGLLGEGGMGRVYLAEDESLSRRVALKILKRTDKTSRRRFIREARAAAHVSHPNLCPIYVVGEEAGRPFLAMELQTGETLGSRIRRGPLSPAETIDLAEDLLAALGALHGAGIVHRDVKPSNFFLTSHGGRLVDFGLASEAPPVAEASPGTTSDIAHPGMFQGTPGYMAPEQILAHVVDTRCDLFAAGVLLYEALSGRRPFSGATAAAVLSATLYDEPEPLGGSPALRALDKPIRRALAKKPAQRFSSAREMADALRRAPGAAGGASRGVAREIFVGRAAELAWLEERFASAAAGAGGVVFVTGERGVGKSALVDEFIRRMKSGPRLVTVLSGRCVETHGPAEAFLPFADVAGRLLTSAAHDRASELLRKYAPTVCVQMASQVPDPDGALHRQAAGATKDRLIREAADFMEAACRDFPILIHLQDLQWADTASVDLLHHLACRLDRQRTLIVGTFRHADVDADNPHLKHAVVDLLARGAAQELALGMLTEQELAAYLDGRFPAHRLPGALPAALLARTEGLPIFVRSLVDILADREEIVRGTDGWTLARSLESVDLEPSRGVQDLVLQQLARLTSEEREILEVASVAGREFLSPVIAHLVGRPEREVEEDLRRLSRVRRVIGEAGEEMLPDGTPATRHRFSHGIYGSVLCEDLVASRRRELHRAVANRLRHHWGTDAPRIATAIARHYEEAHDHEDAIAFRALAGDNAARLYAHAEAEQHYDWAFQSLERLRPESRAAAAISLHRRRGAVRLAQSHFDDATADYEAMLGAARTAAEPIAERAALAGLCDTLFFAERIGEMEQRARELLAVATRAAAEADVDEARARVGLVLIDQGRLDEAAPMLDEVIANSRRRGQRVPLKLALSFRGLVHYWQTEFEEAEETFGEAAATAATLGDGFYALGTRMFVGLARGNLGRMSEAIEDFTDAMAIARRNQHGYWLPQVAAHLGWLHRELGAFDRAHEYNSEAVRLSREQPSRGAESEALVNLCAGEVRAGRGERVSDLLATVQARTAESSWLRWMNELRLSAAAAEHWLARGNHAKAHEHAARLAAIADRVGARDYRCTAERIAATAALGRGEGLEAAARRLTMTVAALRQRPAPHEAWKSARVLALVLDRLGDSAGRTAALEEASRAVGVIAAGTRDEDLRAAFLTQPEVREVLDG